MKGKKRYKKRHVDVQRFIDEYEKVKGKFTVTPVVILTCGGFLTAEEIRLWQILRNRQDKNKKHDGYYKFPVMPTSQSLLAQLMGVDIRHIQRLLKSLVEKRLIKIDYSRGTKNVYWLRNLEDVVEEYKKWVEKWQGKRIRSITFNSKQARKNWENDYLKKHKIK
jgi:hypothetical protein